MPKVSKIQTSFTTGEVAQSIYGRVDVAERYDAALQTCLNYIPTLQGPLIRRPGTKYVTNVKDSTKPGLLFPFQLSGTQGYILEFGDQYCRFYSNDAQLISGTTVFKVQGIYGFGFTTLKFNALRYSANPQPQETLILASSVLSPGSILELTTPFAYADVPNMRISQQGNTIYITHPNYPLQKIVYSGPEQWDIRTVYLQDGPYLPLNTYNTLADGAKVNFAVSGTNSFFTVTTGSSFSVYGAVSSGSSNNIVLRLSGTPQFSQGDNVFVEGIFGTTEANNTVTSNITTSYWTILNTFGSSVTLANSVFQNNIVNSTGLIFPALFMQTYVNSSAVWNDLNPDFRGGRAVGLVNNGTRYWGIIGTIIDPAHAAIQLGIGQNLPSASSVSLWMMGVFDQINGFPAANCIHQNRLFLAGAKGASQEFDGSCLGSYELFSASGSNFQVNDTNALQFVLASQDAQSIYWMKPSSQGLLAGTLSGEWVISPSQIADGLTPTNVTAQQVASFGASAIDSVTLGNAVIYVQKAQRKVRELNYFFQAGTYRSTNISELAEHITLPAIRQLTVQKEINPVIWGLRSDGQMVGLTYNRDEIQIKAGWARHQLGGASDSAGSPPVVKSMAVIAASSGLYDEVWMAVSRSIAGSTVTTIEYMTRPYDYTSVQEDSYYLDCGGTYDRPISVFNITNASSCVVTTANPHGLSASSTIRFYSTVGVNTSIIDVNGNVSIYNRLNYQTFLVTSVSATAFKIQDFSGNDINTTSYSSYLGSSLVRNLVTLVTGLTWLAGETVSLLGDGGVMAQTTVSNVGSVGLSFPAAKVQIGYPYNSDGQLLRSKDGSAQGTSIGSTRRVNRVALMLHDVGEISVGPQFTNLLPVEFPRADVSFADTAFPLVDGVFREGIQGDYTYSDTICFRQSQPLPGMIQAVVRFLEEFDV